MNVSRDRLHEHNNFDNKLLESKHYSSVDGIAALRRNLPANMLAQQLTVRNIRMTT